MFTRVKPRLCKMAELFSTDYPLYSVGTLKNGTFFVAGGGGKAKTGIPNTLVRKKIEQEL